MAGSQRYGFYEFFSGAGMARLGLGRRWQCLFANDIDAKKCRSYRDHFKPADELICDDVSRISPLTLPGRATLAWASFPCQDLSLAGNRRGLNGHRSSTFWPFWRLMQDMRRQNRQVPLIVLENVVGAVTSNSGADFRILVEELSNEGYCSGPLVVDAIHFVPQSRPRLFIVAVDKGLDLPSKLVQGQPYGPWHPTSLHTAFYGLKDYVAQDWRWWVLPHPPTRTLGLRDIVEEQPTEVPWDPPDKTQYLLSLMSDLNLAKVRAAQAVKKRVIGTVYKRTRPDDNGSRRQRAEVRFDNVSGCLRTPVGGSSRQTIIVVEGSDIRSRLLSSREAARLMGLPDEYKLPSAYNDAYHLMGDGVVVPVVGWLEKHLLRPLASAVGMRTEAA